jgi:molybdopterin converting factor subunit 1
MSAIRLDLHLFASYRERIGESRVEVVLDGPATVASLIEHLRGRGAPWTGLPEQPAVAVNQRYARADELLADGDEVALIPPVAGG